MQKRGQATIFIIVGLVILVVIGLMFFFQGDILRKQLSPEDARKLINSQLTPIEEHVEGCIEKVTPDGIKRLALQGGSLSPISYATYNGTKVQFLCYKEPGVSTCIQKPLTRAQMEKEISNYVEFQIKTCLDLRKFERNRNYDLTTGTLSASTKIDDNNIQVSLDFPVTLSRDQVKTTFNEFSSIFRVPLGKLHDLSIDIINSEIEFAEFNNIGYMVQNKGEIIVERHTPYPHEVYTLYPRDGSIVFQFAIEGEDTL
ncbi:MAG: hypothetical protein HYS32_02505 [Candidatus Woesearchaeota archaeon]|nr:MAG: hypothetical protein HYS32_02505 [Candidatus Woesearchaeota archaeon]